MITEEGLQLSFADDDIYIEGSSLVMLTTIVEVLECFARQGLLPHGLCLPHRMS